MNTPTPWVLYAQMSVRDNEGRTVAEFNNPFLPRAECEANTAFVVRAVNSHQSLIDALEKIIKADAYRMAAIAAPDGEKHYEPATENFWAAIDKGRAALALAKEPT